MTRFRAVFYATLVALLVAACDRNDERRAVEAAIVTIRGASAATRVVSTWCTDRAARIPTEAAAACSGVREIPAFGACIDREASSRSAPVRDARMALAVYRAGLVAIDDGLDTTAGGSPDLVGLVLAAGRAAAQITTLATSLAGGAGR